LEGTGIQVTAMPSSIKWDKVNSNIAWLISPKLIWILHTKMKYAFRTAQHHLDVDSPLNTIEVYVSTDFDGLNVKRQAGFPLML
jgi:hypothetical protein